MAEYKHGAYAENNVAAARVSSVSRSAIVYIGTAPVQTVEGGAANVNVPILVRNIAEARKYLGYSDDWASYTLCEAMYAHLEYLGVGPLVFINVLDPEKHKGEPSEGQQLTPVNGRIVIAGAEKIILDSVKVDGKVKGKDFEVAYNSARQTITIQELSSGSLGAEEVQVSYDTIDPSKVKPEDVIGSSDGEGLNTGLCAVKNVYQLTGYYPAYLAAPGFSSDQTVHAAMYENSQKINGHWYAYMFSDLPLTDKETGVTLSTAAKVKTDNGYTHENEKVFFPIIEGTDGRHYHLSVLAAANFQQLLVRNDGIPYMSASNTECGIIRNLYLGEDAKGRVYDDETINNKLNAHGITSAAFVSGRWAIWGSQSAAYDAENEDDVSAADTNRMMLYYISNDFQARRGLNVDKPTTKNDLLMIVSEEQARLDALTKNGALTYGKVSLNAEGLTKSDVMKGNFSFVFNVTATPLAVSLTAIVNLTDDGYEIYFESLAA